LAAHASGIDQHEPAVAHHQRHVDRVTGGTGDLGDDHAVLAEEAVDQ